MSNSGAGSSGGSAPRGGGAGVTDYAGAGGAGASYGGGGAGGGVSGAGTFTGPGGGGGGYSQEIVRSPSGTYYYNIASAGSAGSAGTNGFAGGTGGAGGVVITVYTASQSAGSSNGIASSSVSFSVHKNGTNQIVTAGVATLLTWSNENFDTNNNFDLSTERFTPTVAGKYMVTLTVSCGPSATMYCQARIYKNGSNYAMSYGNSPAGSGGNDKGATVTAIIDMNGTSDYLEAYGFISNATSFDGASASTHFSGALIAPAQATAGGWSNDGTQSYVTDFADLIAIGTSTAAAKLHVWGATGAATDTFRVSTSTGTSLFNVTSAGRVGIGTSSPAALLHVAGSGAVLVLQDIAYASSSNSVSGILSFRDAQNVQYGWIGDGTGTENYIGMSDTRIGGSLRFLTDNTERMRITSNGLFTVSNAAGSMSASSGNTTPGFQVAASSGYVWAATTDAVYVQRSNNTDGTAISFLRGATSVGSIGLTSSATVYNTSSDRRLKENIATTTLGLETLLRLPVRDFSFKSDETHALVTGFIAQELYDIFPWAVTTNGDNGLDPLTATSSHWGVDYGRITPLIVRSIQDLNLKLEDLATTTPISDVLNSTSTGTSTEPMIESFTKRFFTKMIAWFSDTANGIGTMIAGTLKAKDELCVGDVCVDEGTFLQMVQNAGAAHALEENPNEEEEEEVPSPVEEGDEEGEGVEETEGGEETGGEEQGNNGETEGGEGGDEEGGSNSEGSGDNTVE